MNAKVTAEIQEAIRRWMDQHGANKSDVARALGVTEPGVARWLHPSAIGTKIQSHNIFSMRNLGILPADVLPAHAVTYPVGSTLTPRQFQEAQQDPLFRRIEECWPKMTAEEQNQLLRKCAEINERQAAQSRADRGARELQASDFTNPATGETKQMANVPPTQAPTAVLDRHPPPARRARRAGGKPV